MTVRYAREGDVLGIAVLVGGPAEVCVQTLAESTLFRIDAATLTAAARADARVAWALAEELNRRLYETLQQTAINAFGSVRQRVAAHLLLAVTTDTSSSISHSRQAERITARASPGEPSSAGRSRRRVTESEPGICTTVKYPADAG